MFLWEAEANRLSLSTTCYSETLHFITITFFNWKELEHDQITTKMALRNTMPKQKVGYEMILPLQAHPRASHQSANY